MKSQPRAAWTECWEGFPAGWEGACAGFDIETAHPYRISDLLGPDGEPLRVPLPRNRIGFDLTPGGRNNG